MKDTYIVYVTADGLQTPMAPYPFPDFRHIVYRELNQVPAAYLSEQVMPTTMMTQDVREYRFEETLHMIYTVPMDEREFYEKKPDVTIYRYLERF